jgi:hypothetical protein
MNSQEILLSLTGGLSAGIEGSRAIPYLLADETYAGIEFGNSTTRGTLCAKYIALDYTAASTYIINNFGPTTITFNPSAIKLPNKINRIVWSFNDGSPDIVKSFYYTPTSSDTSKLPYPDEPGDPRNFTITKTFATSEYFNKTFTAQAQVYQLGKPDFVDIFYIINIIAPNMDGLNSGFFEEMHLVSTKMFGPNDDILYVFETKNPKYIVPMLVNWHEIPKAPLADTNIKVIHRRPYRLLQPYELDSLNLNPQIRVIDFVPSSNKAGDKGALL